MCATNVYDKDRNQLKFTNSLQVMLLFQINQASNVYEFSTAISTFNIWLLPVLPTV